MKKTTVIVLLILTISGSIAQPYHPLIRTNTTWDQHLSILPVLCYSSGERMYFSGRDTVLNGFTYQICMSQPLITVNPGPFCPPFVIASVACIAAFLRDDTTTRRVYINSAETGGMDDLLYDFSLHAGDTLHSDYLGSGETIVIEAIEEFTLDNGETRKMVVINSLLNSAFIEGIGNTYGYTVFT